MTGPLTVAALASYSFAALAAGPRLLVMGALHGNEHAGAIGAMRVVAALQQDPARLLRGSVTLLPVANPAAYAQRRRYLHVNPNRIFKRHEAATGYEEQLVTRLCDFIDGCDCLLDIHTYVAAPSIPFTFVDRAESLPLAQALGAPYILTGWTDLVGSAQDSNSYAHHAGKVAVTFEAGQGDDPASADRAEAAIWRAAAHLEMIEDVPAGQPVFVEAESLRVHTRIVKARAGTLDPALRHLGAVMPGQVLARYDDGEHLAATTACRIIMPKADARIGDEWYYLAN